jgi:hypothetical protein
VQVRLRGNILHVLCETPQPLLQVPALTRLVTILLDPAECQVVTRAYPQVYQLYVYSRQQGIKQPDWAAPIYLDRLARHQAQLQLKAYDADEIEAAQGLLRPEANRTPVSSSWTENSTTAALVLSQLSLAKRGEPAAIAWYLSEILSSLDVGVWVSIRAVPGPVGPVPPQVPDQGIAQAPSVPESAQEEDASQSRLWIFCEAAYSPDPMLIAEPVTERLRQLELGQFKDAVIVVQVQGETNPDWSLRIDLTPPAEMLAEWGRWGDEQAIVRLLNQQLSHQAAQITVERKDSTLHLVVTGQVVTGESAEQPVPGEETITTEIAATLDKLAPQGLQRAMLYGQPQGALTPTWVKCLNLPALEHEALATSPQALAQQRDWPALRFLLTRLLNPDLDVQLATGGLRVKLLERSDLLHVMVDGPVCPRRQQVVPAVVKQVKAIAPNQIEGLRIYGRRAGQARPAWNYGTDFQTRSRLIPEAEAQFAATDAYVGDLLAHPEAETHAPDLTLGAVGQWLKGLGQQTVGGVRQTLLRSQFFVPSQGLPRELPALPERDRQDALKIGVVWGVLGVLLAVQGDWLLGQLLNPAPVAEAPENTAAISPPVTPEPDDEFSAALSELDWGNGEALDQDSGQLTGDTFADGAEWPLTGEASGEVITPALLETSPYPSFRSQQMDQKLALYHQHLQVDGPPDVLIIGSSRALRGVDPAALRQELATLGYGELDIFNFGVNGSTAQVVDLTLRRILSEDQLPQLVLWADGARAFNSGRVDITFNGIMASEGYRQLGQRNPQTQEDIALEADPAVTDEDALADAGTLETLRDSYQTLDQQLNDVLGQWSAVYGDREDLKAKVQAAVLHPVSNTLLVWQRTPDLDNPQPNTSDRPLSDNSRIDFDGFLAMDVRFNPATYYQLYARVAGDYDSDYRDFELEGDQVLALRRLVQFSQARDIPLIFVNTPLTDEYLDSYRMTAETDFLKFMVEFSANDPDFIFRDLGQIWPQRYDYFSDPSHLNRYGAYQVSNRIAQDPMIPWPHQRLDPADQPTDEAGELAP